MIIYTLMQQMRRAKVLWKQGKQRKSTAARKELDEIFCKNDATTFLMLKRNQGECVSVKFVIRDA